MKRNAIVHFTENEAGNHPSVGPWLRNSLKFRIKTLTDDAKRLRRQYKGNPLMQQPAIMLAMSYESAAQVLNDDLIQFTKG